MTFKQELEVANKERLKEEKNKAFRRKINGEKIYTQYCVWCNGYANEKSKTNENEFKEWLKKERYELTFWEEKHLREKYFGYKYTYNHEKQKWEIEKV